MDGPTHELPDRRVRQVSRRIAGGLSAIGRALLCGWLDREVEEEPSSALSVRAPRSGAWSVALAAGLAGLLVVSPALGGSPVGQATGNTGRGSTGWLERALVTAASGRAVLAPTGVVALPARLDGTFLSGGALSPPLVSERSVPSTSRTVTRYRVQPGDAVSLIAERFDVRPMTLWWANRLSDLDALNIGQKVRVLPTSGIEHRVHDGDTLDSIARAFRADAADIARFNGIEGGVVVLGQRLIIPAGNGSRYEPVPGVDHQTPIPRLGPGQADRAAVAQPAVAAPLIQPVVPQTEGLGVKRSGGIGWPLSPDWTAGGSWIGTVRDPDGDRATLVPRFVDVALPPSYLPAWNDSDSGPSAFIPSRYTNVVMPLGRDPSVDRSTPPAIGIPTDAPTPHGDGRHRTDWPPGGPEAGPPQGRVLQINDPRLRLTVERALARGLMVWPVHGDGHISQYFSGEHFGLDIAAPKGTPVVATYSGRVIYRGWRDNRGANSVWIKHGPQLYSSYAHLWQFAVRRGQWVERGQVIGYVGSSGYSTGPHLHFAVTVGDHPNAFSEAVNPLPFVVEQ